MAVGEMELRGVGEAGFERLRGRFRGAPLRPSEEGYDEARRVWNGAIDRRPALIARCAGADDVVEAVRFAASTRCSFPSAGAATRSPAIRSAIGA